MCNPHLVVTASFRRSHRIKAASRGKGEGGGQRKGGDAYTDCEKCTLFMHAPSNALPCVCTCMDTCLCKDSLCNARLPM